MSAVMENKEALPTEFVVRLPITEEMQVSFNLGGSALAEANEFVIDCAEMAQIASDNRNGLTKAIAAVEAERKGFLEPAQTIIERAKALFNPTIKGLTEAKTIYGQKLLSWQQDQERRIAEENAKREAEARKVRQEAEAKAKADMARAAEVAAEQRRVAEAAERDRQKALADGNARAAAAAAADAARANEKAAAAIENGNAKAVEAQLSAAAVVAQAAPQKVAAVSGFTSRKNWNARFQKGLTEHDVIRLIAAELPARPDLVALLCLDTSACNKMAKALESALNIPGMESFDSPVAAGRSR